MTTPTATFTLNERPARSWRAAKPHHRPRLSRAHLLLARRPQLANSSRHALETTAAALGERFQTPVKLAARVLDATACGAAGLSESAAFAVFELGSMGVMGLAEFDRSLVVSALDTLFGGSGELAFSTKLTRIEEAGFSFLCLVALGALKRSVTFEKELSARLVSVHASRDAAIATTPLLEPHLVVAIDVELPRAAAQARLFIPARALEAAIHRLPEICPSKLPSQISTAALRTRVLLGNAYLDATDVEALSTGDVVKFGCRAVAGEVQGAARLCAPSFELDGELKGDLFHMDRARVSAIALEEPMQLATRSSLPVDVEVALAQVRLTLEELSAAAPGAVLPLHVSTAEPVLLRIGDRLIARAELVEIEGELGARILSLLS